MKRRFNYTDRKRITRDRISIIVNRTDHTLESFQAAINLKNMELPEQARLYIEAGHQTEFIRYDFGKVGEIVSPSDTSLSDLAHHEDLRFRILVVDESHVRGLILALADRIRPSGIVLKHSILPVEFRDLGRQVWKIAYNGDGPILVLNDRVPNIHNIARTDVRFHLYVYPAVVRDIFKHMFLVDSVIDLDEPPQEWHSKWLAFARMFMPDDTWAQLRLQDDHFDTGDIITWIDVLVEEFCASRSREWLKLISLEEVG